MQKDRRKDQVLHTFAALDLLAAGAAVLTFLGVGAKVFLAWIVGS